MIAHFDTLDEQISSQTVGPRFNSILPGVFASLALLMTVVGLYGVLSFAVAQRTQEIGIRLALGAQQHGILVMVMAEGAVLIAIGLLGGSSAFWFLSRYLQSFLYGVAAHDPRTFAAILLVATVVAFALLQSPHFGLRL